MGSVGGDPGIGGELGTTPGGGYSPETAVGGTPSGGGSGGTPGGWDSPVTSGGGMDPYGEHRGSNISTAPISGGQDPARGEISPPTPGGEDPTLGEVAGSPGGPGEGGPGSIIETDLPPDMEAFLVDPIFDFVDTGGGDVGFQGPDLSPDVEGPTGGGPVDIPPPEEEPTPRPPSPPPEEEKRKRRSLLTEYEDPFVGRRTLLGGQISPTIY